MTHSSTVALTCQLIEQQSITPEDAGCQKIIADRLKPLGFTAESMRSGDVENIWLRKGTDAPLLVLAGHTDVVPAGPLSQWRFPPFKPTIENQTLYGRGAADMKGGLAAMVTAVESFLAHHPNHNGSIAFLITSDEEGPAINGTRKAVEILKNRNETIDWCLIGEPSSTELVGDTVKHGRRGSLTGILKIIGTQGHIAYPHLANNPIHHAAGLLDSLTREVWDEGNEDFPPTSLQIIKVNSDAGAGNVIPGLLSAQFNFRFSTEVTHESLQKRVEEICETHHVNYELEWILSGSPFITPPGRLRTGVDRSIKKITGKSPLFSTSGGTSDGRFIAATGADIVEVGLCNKTIHQVNECTGVDDIDTLSLIYNEVLKELLLQ